MNEVIKRLWQKDLHANADTQGYGGLRTRVGDDWKYCCLGRLCELHRTQTGEGYWDEQWYVLTGGGSNDMLPNREVVEWAGLQDRDPVVHEVELSDYNDGFKCDFHYIAELIENL